MKFIDFDREYSSIVHELETGKITLGEYSDLGEALLNKVKAEAIEEYRKEKHDTIGEIAKILNDCANRKCKSCRYNFYGLPTMQCEGHIVKDMAAECRKIVERMGDDGK